MISIESPRFLEVSRPTDEPYPEYPQTAEVSFDGLAGRALANYLGQIAPGIRNGQTDQYNNSRLVAVIPGRYKAKLRQAQAAGFRTAEIDNVRQLVGIELVPEGDRTRPVKVNTGLEIIQDT